MEISSHAFQLVLFIGSALGVIFCGICAVIWHIIKKLTDTLLANTIAMVEMKGTVDGMKKDIEGLKENNPVIQKLKSDLNVCFEKIRAFETFNQTKEI